MASPGGIRAGRAYVEIGTSDRLTAGLRAAQAKLKAFAAGVQATGRSLLKVSAAGVVPAALAVRTFASFEQAMARVRALSGATGQDFASLEGEAKRLGESTVFSATQAAEAMAYFALAGFDVATILKAIGPALDLAAAGQIEIAQAADITSKIMAGMGIAAEDLGHAVDVMAKAMTTANTDLVQLGDAMKYIGPLAKSAGLDFEEIVGAVQLLSNAGIQGEQAGSTLRGMLIALTSPSKEAKDTLAQLSVAIADANGDVRPLADIIEDLAVAMDGLGSAERLDVLGRIFQARAVTGVAELLSQGSDRLREFQRNLEGAGGTAARISGTQLNTLRGAFTITISALEGLQIAVGEALGPPLRLGIELVTQAIGAATQWARANKLVVIAVVAVAVAVGIAGAVLLAAGVAAQIAAFAFGGLATITGLVVAAFGLLVSPVALVVAGLVAATIGFVRFTAVGGRAADVIGSNVAAVVAYVGERLGSLVQTLSATMGGMSDAIAAGELGLAAEIAWLGVKTAFLDGTAEIRQYWSDLWSGLLLAQNNAITALLKTWARFVSGSKSAIELFRGAAVEAYIEVRSQFDDSFDPDAAKDIARGVRDRRLSNVVREEEDALKQIQDAHEAAEEQITNDALENDRKRREQIDSSRDRLESALEEARKAREDREAGQDGAAPPALKGLGESALDGIADALNRGFSSAGTFNARALLSLAGGGTAAERTAKATEDTARNTGRIAQEAKKGNLKFT